MMRPTKKPAARVLERIHAGRWLCTPDCLETILTIASRENFDPAAVAAELGRPLDNTRSVTVRDGVATIPVVGPMFRYADFFTEISGAVTYEELATDFQKAMDDPAVRAIIFAMDTPGGEATGVSELSQLIRSAVDADLKPIVAHAEEAASAGYWIASATREISVADAGVLGSIGVRATIRDTRAIDEARGVRTYEIISSQSPNKRMDPATDLGRAQIQAVIDDLAQVFVQSVADYRGVDAETVLRDFGQGGLLVGQRAVDAGLADRISTYESVVAELQDTTRARPRWSTSRSASSSRPSPRALASGSSSTQQDPDTMKENPNPGTPEPAAQPAASAPTPAPATPPAPTTSASIDTDKIRADERTRIAEIRALGRPGEETLVQECVDDPSCTKADAALRLRAAENVTFGDRLAKMLADASAPAPAGVPAPANPETATPRAAARRATSQFYELTGRGSKPARP